MKVYKVVRVCNGRLLSAVVRGKAEVEYKPGEWVVAPEWLASRGYYLTAFKRLEDAVEFMKYSAIPMLGDGESVDIWEAEADELVPLPEACYIVDLAEGRLLAVGYWWPSGTVMCKRLKLVRQVPLSEAFSTLKR